MGNSDNLLVLLWQKCTIQIINFFPCNIVCVEFFLAVECTDIISHDSVVKHASNNAAQFAMIHWWWKCKRWGCLHVPTLWERNIFKWSTCLPCQFVVYCVNQFLFCIHTSATFWPLHCNAKKLPIATWRNPVLSQPESHKTLAELHLSNHNGKVRSPLETSGIPPTWAWCWIWKTCKWTLLFIWSKSVQVVVSS